MLNSNDAASTSACDSVRAQTGEESEVRLEMAEGGRMVVDNNDKDSRKVHHWTWSLAGKLKD